MRSKTDRLWAAAAAVLLNMVALSLLLSALQSSESSEAHTLAQRPEALGATVSETVYLPLVMQGPSGLLYSSPTSYTVGIFGNYTVTDPGRNRSFPILIRYPIGAPMPLPVVVFSHGGGANNFGHLKYEEWGTRLAQAGYVTIHMAHVVPNSPGEHCQALGIPPDECEPEDFQKEPADGGTLISFFYHKPRDASAVLDELDALEVKTGAQFDRDRLAVAGHSGGTHTVMQLAGAAVDFSPSVTGQVYHDSRFTAFLATSPQGIGTLGLTASSWDNITVPVMIATGLADVGSAVPDPVERLDPFINMPGPDKYQLYIDDPGATHNVFALNILDGPGYRPLTPLEQLVLSSGLAFLDAHVHHSAAAEGWLRSGSIELWSAGVATIDLK